MPAKKAYKKPAKKPATKQSSMEKEVHKHFKKMMGSGFFKDQIKKHVQAAMKGKKKGGGVVRVL